jgi:hypothetical protein
MSVLKLELRSDKPCDSELGLQLNGELVVERLATAYDTDGLHRGVHAGDFVWLGQQFEITGRMSGITNAGILRARVFTPACEKCLAPGVMIGRLCGEVVKTHDPELKGARLVAVYRLLAARPRKTGVQGPSIRGTIEGVIVTKC